MKLEPIKAPEATARINPLRLSDDEEEEEETMAKEGAITHFVKQLIFSSKLRRFWRHIQNMQKKKKNPCNSILSLFYLLQNIINIY